MRVSLQIDGDSSGAVKAASDTSASITDLGKQTDAISHAIEDGFKNAAEALDALKNKSQAAGAANDNNANSALGLAAKLSQVAGAAAGVDSALAKSAAGAVNFAKGFGDVIRSVGAFNIIGGVIGLASTAATTFYGVINSGSVESSKHLGDTTDHIQAANAAYAAAAKSAGAYYTQANNIAILDSNKNLQALKADQQKNSGAVANLLTPSKIGIFNGSIPGEDAASGLAGALFPDQANDRFKSFQPQIDAINASIAAGSPQWEKFGQDVAAAGNAALATNPAIFATSVELLKLADARIKGGAAISAEETNLRLYTGTATKADLASRGLTSTANDNFGSFERLSKSMERQSAAQAADAQTAGLSAGATAKLRAEFILTEAVNQSGAGAAAKYAAEIKGIADRAGEAAQKLALARLQSDTAFNRDQIGRTTIDASVADQLRGAFGNKADLDGDAASLVRFNETMKDVKSTTQDLASGAFRDFRTAVQGGASALTALGTAGVNALNKIIDKLADKAFDKLISGALSSFGGDFGSFFGVADPGSSAKPLAGLTADDYGPGFAFGGYTGAGGKYQPAGVVHKDEYVFDQDATRRIGVGNLERLRRGYADGGLVGSSNPWGNLAQPAGQGGGGVGGTVRHIHEVVVTVDDDGKLKAYVKNVSQQTTTEGISGYAASPAFIAHVADASNAAKTSRML